MLHRVMPKVVLVMALSWSQAWATTNDYLHVYYYGWFPNHWSYTTPDNRTGIPASGNRLSPSNQCDDVTSVHLHTNAYNDIASVFWPLLGNYSNSDSSSPATLNTHRQNIVDSGSKAVIISYGSESYQPSAAQVNYIATRMAASGSGLRAAFAIRDYTNPDRTKASTKSDITRLLGTSNQYRVKLDTYNTEDKWKGKYHPIFYLYNWSATSTDWSGVFKKGKTFRKNNNFLVLASGADGLAPSTISLNGFDGHYNYTPGQTKSRNFYATQSATAWGYPGGGFIFSAGVSPGYNTLRTKNSKTPRGF